MRRRGMMRHGPSRMVLRGRLREPYISSIAREFPAIQRPNNGVPVANLAARRVYDIGTAPHFADQRVIEHVLGLGMQWCVNGNYVTDLHQRLNISMKGNAKLLFDCWRQTMPVGVLKIDVKWFHTSQYGKANPACADDADIHPLKIIRARHAISDIPTTLQHPLMRRNIITHEREDHRHRMLCCAHAVA